MGTGGRLVIPGVSVIIPTVAPRANMLQRALASVTAQTLQPDAVIVQEDTEREGAAATRQRAQDRVTTEWTAPLDDDDSFYPQHLEVLAAEAARTGADLVYSWFDVCNGTDPFPQFFDKPWSNDDPHLFPVTWLGRTEAIQAAGGWADGSQGLYGHADVSGEDWRLILALVANDAHIVHLAQRTWQWTIHGGNSSGLARNVRWDG